MPVTTISAEQVHRHPNGRSYAATNSNRRQRNRHGYRPPYRCRAKQTTPRPELVKECEVIALDVEGVQLHNESRKRKQGVGRVSIVNEQGQVVYDTFAFYPNSILHEPSPQYLRLGVKPSDILEGNGARPIAEIMDNVESICKKAGSVVCHAIDNEINYMRGGMLSMTDRRTIDIGGFDLTRFRTYDTQTLPEYKAVVGGDAPSLKKLVSAVLGRAIQVKEHSSVDDAQATMELFLRRRKAFEAAKPSISPSSPSNPSSPSSEDEIVLPLSDISLSSLATNDATTTEPPPGATTQKPASEKVVVSHSWASVAAVALRKIAANAEHPKFDIRASKRP